MSKKPIVVLWTIIWLALTLGLFELALSSGFPWKFSGLEPYMLRKKNDDWTHIAFEIQNIRNRDRGTTQEFYVYLGGSAGLESISSDLSLRDNLRSLMGREVGFVSLCSSYKTFVDEAKIIRGLGEFGGTVIIPMEVLRFKTKTADLVVKYIKKLKTTNLKHYYSPVTPGAVSILTKNGLEMGLSDRLIFIRSSMVFGEILKKKAFGTIKTGFKVRRFKHDRHAVGDKTPVNEENRKKQVGWLKKLLGTYDEYREVNLALLKDAIDTAHSLGAKVILMDLPTNPIYDEMMAKFYPHYDRMISDLVKEKGLGYIDMRYAAEWTPEDYRDVHHMRSPGQKKFTPALARKLAGYPESLGGLKRLL